MDNMGDIVSSPVNKMFARVKTFLKFALRQIYSGLYLLTQNHGRQLYRYKESKNMISITKKKKNH